MLKNYKKTKWPKTVAKIRIKYKIYFFKKLEMVRAIKEVCLG
jgi:hypothetical protein